MIGVLIVFTLIIYVLFLRFLLKNVRNRYLKYSLLFVIVLLPLSDELAGRMYFEYLCKNKTELRIYQTVLLPSAFWDSNGKPNFFEENGNYYLEDYPQKYKKSVFNSTFNIEKWDVSIVNRETGVILGGVTDYLYWGGWIRRGISSNNVANTCKGQLKRSNELKHMIFKQQN